MLEGTALLCLLCCVAMMLVAVAAAFLDVPRYAAGFVGAGLAFLIAMWFAAMESRKLVVAASRREELNRRMQLRATAQS